MLHICSDINKTGKFKDLFYKNHKNVIDLSRTSCDILADECDSILHHHTECAVYFGYLEPGWMLDPFSQTRLRKIIRKYPVGMCTHYMYSLPFSWKNEIEVIYTFDCKNGVSEVIDDGSPVYYKSKI